MRERLFTPIELDYVAPKADPVPSLAARFAAREAVMKALGLGLGAFGFHDVWVEVEPSGAPRLVVTARARELAVDRGVVRWHLSLTHDGPVASRWSSPSETPPVTSHRDPDRHAGGDGGDRRGRAGAGRGADRAGRRGRRPARPRDARRHVRPHASTVIAGKGNNGNDGRVAAALLAERGVRVRLFDAADCPPELPPADLVIDAAYGTGFHGEWRAPRVGAAPGARRRHPERRRRADGRGRSAACSPPTAR